MADVPRCPETGAPMARGARPMTIAYKGLTASFDQPGWYSVASDEGILSGPDNAVWSRELARLKARAAGLLQPHEVRAVREKLGLTQREAGRLIGGGPNAFQKYESGEILVSKAVSNLLVVLSNHPEQLSELQHREVEPV